MQEEDNATAGAPSATTAQELPHDTQAPDGLSPLHIAVIKNDREGVRKILASRERGVDERTAQDATPLMMACLFGRPSIFFSLVRKKASTLKKDINGLGLLDYVNHVPATETFLKEYQAFTGQQPSCTGRKTIFSILQVCIQKSRESKILQHDKETQAEAEVDVGVGTLSAAEPAVQVTAAPSEDESDMNTVFMRNGKELRITKVRILQKAKFFIDLGRKSCGAVRGKDEKEFRMISISGWRGDKAEEGAPVLCNKTYSSLARSLCALYGLELPANCWDCKFVGDPSEKTGAYFSCHAEKALAIWVLEESLFHVKGTRHLNRADIAFLKEHVDQLPPNLRESVIELDHQPCKSCDDFFTLIYDNAGIRIECQPCEWFVRGVRRRLRKLDGVRTTAKSTEDTFEDEMDEYDVLPGTVDANLQQDGSECDDHEMAEPVSLLLTPDGHTQSDDPASTPLPPTKRPSRRDEVRPLGASSPLDPYPKHASPVRSWPPPDLRYRAKKIKMASLSTSRRRATARASAESRSGSGSKKASSLPSSSKATRGSSSSSSPASSSPSASLSDSPGTLAAASSPAPAMGEDSNLTGPLDICIPIKQLAPGAPSLPQEELDQAILDEPIAEPFPNASRFGFNP